RRCRAGSRCLASWSFCPRSVSSCGKQGAEHEGVMVVVTDVPLVQVRSVVVDLPEPSHAAEQGDLVADRHHLMEGRGPVVLPDVAVHEAVGPHSLLLVLLGVVVRLVLV